MDSTQLHPFTLTFASKRLETQYWKQYLPKLRGQFRIGMNSGPVVAGVIGHTKFHYDVWGDTVDTASRMESHGLPGQIQITRATCELLEEEFICEPRGTIQVNGLGEMESWLLLGVRAAPGQAEDAAEALSCYTGAVG